VPEGKENILSQRLTRPVGLLSAGSTPRSTPRSTPIRSLSPAIPRKFNLKRNKFNLIIIIIKRNKEIVDNCIKGNRIKITFRRTWTQITASFAAERHVEASESLPAEILRGAAQPPGPGRWNCALPVRRSWPSRALDKMGQKRYHCNTERENLHQGAGRR